MQMAGFCKVVQRSLQFPAKEPLLARISVSTGHRNIAIAIAFFSLVLYVIPPSRTYNTSKTSPLLLFPLQFRTLCWFKGQT